MAKRKKTTGASKSSRGRVAKNASRTRRSASKSKSIASKKSNAGKGLWLNSNGTLNRRLKISKYLTKDGRIRKNAKLPKQFKTARGLYNYLYPAQLPEWYTKDGKVRAQMLKYLTKKGTLRKNVTLPDGVRTIKDLWDYVKSGTVKSQEDPRAKCFENVMYHWEFTKMVNRDFEKYRSVIMGNKKITRKDWDLYGDDYVMEVCGAGGDIEGYELVYMECRVGKFTTLIF